MGDTSGVAARPPKLPPPKLGSAASSAAACGAALADAMPPLPPTIEPSDLMSMRPEPSDEGADVARPLDGLADARAAGAATLARAGAAPEVAMACKLSSENS